MKTLLLSALLLLAAISAKAQLVTNSNVDLVWSQATDDTLRIAWHIDENLRTNGIAPYTNVQAQVTFKVFLGELCSTQAENTSSTLVAQNEARFFQAFRGLQVTNASAYNRLYRIAFNKGSQ